MLIPRKRAVRYNGRPMEKCVFTVSEARRVLPLVKELAARMVAISGRIESCREVVQGVAAKNASNSGSPEGTVFVEQLIALQSCLNQMQATGCLVKSVQEGLVDFPHLKDGREVYLCWKLGEEDIQFWHEVDGGFARRTPLSETQ
ncbi:MAG: DUF2203 domain-containing protein [Acidobacteriota bacterium]